MILLSSDHQIIINFILRPLRLCKSDMILLKAKNFYQFWLVTAHIQRMGKVMFSVWPPPGAYPSPMSFPRSLVPGPFWGWWVPQSQVLSKVSGPRAFPEEYPSPSWEGVPQDRCTPSQDRSGVPPARTGKGYRQSGQDWGTPQPGQEWVPPGTGYAAGSMPHVVSRRKTFLFVNRLVLQKFFMNFLSSVTILCPKDD